MHRENLIGKEVSYWKKKAEEKVQTKFKVALEGLGVLSLSTVLYVLCVTGNCRKERVGEGWRGHTKPVVTLTPLPNKKGFREFRCFRCLSQYQPRRELEGKEVDRYVLGGVQEPDFVTHERADNCYSESKTKYFTWGTSNPKKKKVRCFSTWHVSQRIWCYRGLHTLPKQNEFRRDRMCSVLFCHTLLDLTFSLDPIFPHTVSHWFPSILKDWRREKAHRKKRFTIPLLQFWNLESSAKWKIFISLAPQCIWVKNVTWTDMRLCRFLFINLVWVCIYFAADISMSFIL